MLHLHSPQHSNQHSAVLDCTELIFRPVLQLAWEMSLFVLGISLSEASELFLIFML